MTDINQNIGADKLNQISSMNFKGLEKEANFAPKNYTEKEIKNLDNAHAALVGRSMIKKYSKTPKVAEPNFDGKLMADIKADLAEFKANPELAKKALALGDAAMTKGYTYEQAAAITREFMDSYKS